MSKFLSGKESVGPPPRRVQIYNSSDYYSPDASREIVVHEKSEVSKSFLLQILSAHYLFDSLVYEDLERMISAMCPLSARAGEVIFRQGDLGDLFYCLESGEAEASVDGVGKVMSYKASSCFGELALIYNTPRAASVTSVTPCRLWALDLRTFRFVMATTLSSRVKHLCEFLRKCSYLDLLSNEQIGMLAESLDICNFEPDEVIIRQGDKGDRFYIIKEGKVKCTQRKSGGREVDLLTLPPGEYIGEMALILDDVRQATCAAVGMVTCLCLDRQKFDALLEPVHNVLARRLRIRILQSVPLLARFPENKLVRLASVMRMQTFADKSYIVRQGEEGSRFYIINEGEVRSTRTNAAGEEEEVMCLSAQDFFGDRALITNEASKANYIASGSVDCIVLERKNFQALSDVQEYLKAEITRKDTGAPYTDKEIVRTGPVTSHNFSDLRMIKTIGTGIFGRVKIVQHVPTGQVYALKCMSKIEIASQQQEENIMSEKTLLFECSASAFILALYQTYNHANIVYMLMEFIQGGELWSYLYDKVDGTIPRCSHGGFELNAVKFYASNVLLALKHLHDKSIAYRDMKPENLLIDKFGYVKMIDFGFAKKFPFMKNGEKQDKTYTLCGTPDYVSPEIVMSSGYDKSADCWAFGCLLYEFYLSKTPFQADLTTMVFKKIVAAEKNLTFPHKLDPQLIALVKKLLTVNPAFRLGNLSGGIQDIMDDPFFSTLDWNACKERTLASPYSPPIKNPLDSSNFDDYEEEEFSGEYVGSQESFAGF